MPPTRHPSKTTAHEAPHTGDPAKHPGDDRAHDEPSPAALKSAFAQFTSGVTVVLGRHEGALFGMTISAFTTVSLHPPLVLVCVGRSASQHDALVAADTLGVSILAQTQHAEAARLAGPGDRFTELRHVAGAKRGVPLLEDALAWLEVDVAERRAVGDHTILLLAVRAASTRDGMPLLYGQRRFGRFEVLL